MTTNGTQTTENVEIWSTILTGVASSKMVPTKKLLVLGDPGSGKSTLIHYLKNDPGPQMLQPEADNAPNNNFGVNNNYNHNNTTPLDNLDDDATNTLALGYSFIDVQDEENEAVARLGVYQLGLSSVEYMPLLKFALGTDTLSDSTVVIVLDWTRPWEFLETLQRWINVLQHRMDEICKEGSAGESSWSRGKAVVDELREKIEYYLQTYTEPIINPLFPMTASTSTGSIITPTTVNPASTLATAPLVTTTTAADQVTLPLTQGSLTNNLGISIIVVCCKSDAQNTLEQTLDYKDEQFDFIQQTLRCVCMKFGAALFYTSTLQPYTFHNLRQYILHRLLTTSSKSYPFKLKAQVVERDAVLVPAGWDSWGKLRVLREGFDCDAVNQGWEADMDAVTDRQQPSSHGARGNYEDIIHNPNSDDQPLHNIPPPVTCEDEQAFLDRHFETLQHVSEIPSRKGTGAQSTTRPSVVGPIGESVLDMGRNDDRRKDDLKISISSSSNTSTMNANATTTSHAIPPIDTSHMQSPHSIAPITTTLGGPTVPTVPGGGAGGPSHEVLANFFQSLLSKKASSGGSSPTTTSLLNTMGREEVSSTTTNTTSASSGTTRRPTVSRKDVHKELDRMRQFVNKQ